MAKKSKKDNETTADRKLTIYMRTAEERQELERIAALEMPGVTVQMFVVEVVRSHMRRYQQAEEEGRVEKDEWDRMVIIEDE